MIAEMSLDFTRLNFYLSSCYHSDNRIETSSFLLYYFFFQFFFTNQLAFRNIILSKRHIFLIPTNSEIKK